MTRTPTLIKITVELISAIDGHQEILGEGFIYNDASGSRGIGNYGFKLSKRRGFTGHRNVSGVSNVWKSGEVKDFPRLRRNGWDLLFRCLRESIGDRNK